MKSKAIIPASLGVLAFATLCPATMSAALIHHWALDETTLPDNISNSPGTVVDSTGNSTAGRLFGYAPGTDLAAAGVIGVAGPPGFGTAYNFTESTGISGVFTNSNDAIPTVGDFSLFLQVATTNQQTVQGHLFSNNTGQLRRSNLYIQSGQLGFFLDGGAFDTNNDGLSDGNAFSVPVNSTVPGGINIFDGQYHQIGVAREGTRFDLVVDGGVITSGVTTTNGTFDTLTSWMIGRARNSSGDLDATIADVKIFDVYSVPEPSSLALLGLGGLLLVRRRR